MMEKMVHNPLDYTYNENENVRKSGERVWVAWTNRPIHDERDRTTGVLCIGTDMTERKRAQEETQRYLSRTLVLNRVMSAITSTLDAQTVLENSLPRTGSGVEYTPGSLCSVERRRRSIDGDRRIPAP